MISENGALVEFFSEAVQNNFKTAQEGRPIFEDKVFVRIQTPGDTRTSIHRMATDIDKERFSKAWEFFEKGQTVPLEGTPLEHWPTVAASQVRELAHVHVRTVEQLAALSDASIQRMGPGYDNLRRQAVNFLKAAEGAAVSTEVMRENERLKEEIELLKEQVEGLLKAKGKQKK